MDKSLELLRKQIDEKSMGKVAKELGISKPTVSLVARGKYPNPQNIYMKVKEVYGELQTEIIGVDTTANLGELAKELGCI